MHPSPMNAVLALPRWFTQRPIQPMGLLYLASVIRREGHRARETFVALGGPHASSLPDRSMQECDALDAVVFGEGERTILEILDRLAARESLEGVHGTAYRDPGGIVVNASRELVDDLDAIPFPAWDLIPMHKYVASTWFPNKVKQYTNIFTSRPNFFISDDLFTLKRERVLDICNLILEKRLPITWTCLSRVNTVDPEMLALMKQAGCYLISYGLESRSQEVLDKLDKGTTVEQGIAAVEMTKAAGIKVFGSFMIGSPGETIETVEATIKLIRKLKLDEVGLGVTTAYPGTDLLNLRVRRKGPRLGQGARLQSLRRGPQRRLPQVHRPR